MLAAVAPLGADYQAVIQRAYKERWIDLFPNEGKRSGAYSQRRRVRRPPVHAPQLQRQVRRCQHAGPRAGPHDAELLLEQDAAIPARGLPDLRRRSGVHVQRGAAHRLHAQEHQGSRCAPVAPRELPGRHQGHGLPADAVRRVRAAHARIGAEGAADHRRRAGEAVHGHHEALLRPRHGRLHRGRLHRARVELHPALLPRFLRLPVRDVLHRVGGAGREGQGRRRGGARNIWRSSPPADRNIRSIF